MDENFWVHWHDGDVAAHYWLWRGMMVRHILQNKEFRVTDATVKLFLTRAINYNLPFNEEWVVKFIYQITADTIELYCDFQDYEKTLV